jgi:hypothetical protein
MQHPEFHAAPWPNGRISCCAMTHADLMQMEEAKAKKIDQGYQGPRGGREGGWGRRYGRYGIVHAAIGSIGRAGKIFQIPSFFLTRIVQKIQIVRNFGLIHVFSPSPAVFASPALLGGQGALCC